MSNVLAGYAPNANFWDNNPQLTAAGPIGKLWASDKSRMKGTSSKLMWCIALIWDKSSEYYKLPESTTHPDSKITLIFGDVFGNKNYYESNKKQVDELKTYYQKLHETVALRTLREIETKLEQRAKFINETDYELGDVNERGAWVGNTSTILDKMMVDTKKIYDVYEQALKIVEAEQLDNDDINKGGGEASLSDQNRI